MSSATTASVSTHILDTSIGRPAGGVAVELSVRGGSAEPWTVHGSSQTDADGRCKELPALPEGTTTVRLHFAVERYLTARAAADTTTTITTTDPRAEAGQDAPRTRDSAVFFPEVTIVFNVTPGEHYHVPLLLNPYGYSVYRGS